MQPSTPNQRLPQQYQAFLDLPDLFEHHPNPPYLPFVTTPLPLNATIVAHWQATIPPRLVLGKRVEYFLHYYIQQQAHLEIRTHNLQIIREKQTIGELDFLYDNQQEEQGYHLEQVYKFYIYWPDEKRPNIERWIGPNNKDNLVQKLAKLRTRQFPLLHHPSTQALLLQKNITTTNRTPQLSFKAALFTPWEQPFPTESALNPACWRGHWLTWDSFLQQNWEGAQFFLPEKQDWGCTPTPELSWLDWEAAILAIKSWLERQKAPLCWIKTATGAYQQLFVLWW